MSEDQKDKYPAEGESRPTFEGTRFDDQDLQKVHTQLMREKEGHPFVREAVDLFDAEVTKVDVQRPPRNGGDSTP